MEVIRNTTWSGYRKFTKVTVASHVERGHCAGPRLYWYNGQYLSPTQLTRTHLLLLAHNDIAISTWHGGGMRYTECPLTANPFSMRLNISAIFVTIPWGRLSWLPPASFLAYDKGIVYRVIANNVKLALWPLMGRPTSASSSLRITDRSFRYASTCLWNQLPSSLRQPHSSPSVSDLPVHAPATSSYSLNWYTTLTIHNSLSLSLPAQYLPFSTNLSHHRLPSGLRTASTAL